MKRLIALLEPLGVALGAILLLHASYLVVGFVTSPIAGSLSDFPLLSSELKGTAELWLMPLLGLSAWVLKVLVRRWSKVPRVLVGISCGFLFSLPAVWLIAQSQTSFDLRSWPLPWELSLSLSIPSSVHFWYLLKVVGPLFSLAGFLYFRNKAAA